jgi:hypothetical protein
MFTCFYVNTSFNGKARLTETIEKCVGLVSLTFEVKHEDSEKVINIIIL